jgi:DNA replication and repair protein RecF
MHGFRSADKELIAFNETWSRLEAMTDTGSRVVKMQAEKPTVIEIDGVSRRRLTAQYTLPVVVFEPEHMLLLGNEPERRRAYLDSLLSQTKPGYKVALQACKRALAQRNRLLKSEDFHPDQLFVWDVSFAQKAGIVATARYELIKELNTHCQNHYQTISRSTASLELGYASKLDPDNYTEQLLQYLRQSISVDRQRGFTTAGPHRDDVSVVLKGSDARDSASRGETRSIILAMKIVELQLLHTLREQKPILLLDDVFSELDGVRRRSLAESLSEYQTFLTTTDADVAVDHFSAYNIIPMG